MQQLDIFDVLYPNFKFGEKIRVFEAFAGVGAQIKALKRLSQKYDIEIESVGISEIDKYAIQSYMAVHGETKNYGDISKINGKDLPQIDLFTYSFPCQDISIAGHQEGFAKGSGTRSGLLWEVERILKEMKHKPKVLLMENVKNLISEKHMDDFIEWQNELENMGYMNYWEVLNAKDYGIPQNRERVFMVSILGEFNYNFPKPFPLELRLKDMLESEVDEKYYLSDKMLTFFYENSQKNQEKGNGFRFTHKMADEIDYAKTITTHNGSRMDDNFITEVQTDKTLCLNSKVNGKQPSLQDRIYDTEGIATAITTSFMPNITEPQSDKLIHVGNMAGGKWDKIHESSRRVYSEDGLAPTIPTCQGGNIEPKVAIKVLEATQKGYAEATVGDSINLEQPNYKTRRGRVGKQVAQTLTTQTQQATVTENLRIRKLTPLECWRLMGFDDEDFQKAKDSGVSDTQLYIQAGNSIVVDVLEHIFEMMIK